ncbi:MAG: hypothetical protein HOO98_09150 [Nitrospira sp.]|nr:hypothetical protein [Nitrospira sp.]
MTLLLQSPIRCSDKPATGWLDLRSTAGKYRAAHGRGKENGDTPDRTERRLGLDENVPEFDSMPD